MRASLAWPSRFSRQALIFALALVEHVVDGKGVLKDGGWGSAGEAAGCICALCVRCQIHASDIKIPAQGRFTGAGGIEDPLVCLGDGQLLGASLLGRLADGRRLVKLQVGQIRGVLVFLVGPGGQANQQENTMAVMNLLLICRWLPSKGTDPAPCRVDQSGKASAPAC